MTLNLKIIIAVIVVIIIGGAVYAFDQFRKNNTPFMPDLLEINKERERLDTLLLAPATGNVDETVNSLISFSNNEQAALDVEDNEALLINIDSQAIDEFGQSYNEEF